MNISRLYDQKLDKNQITTVNEEKKSISESYSIVLIKAFLKNPQIACYPDSIKTILKKALFDSTFSLILTRSDLFLNEECGLFLELISFHLAHCIKIDIGQMISILKDLSLFLLRKDLIPKEIQAIGTFTNFLIESSDFIAEWKFVLADFRVVIQNICLRDKFPVRLVKNACDLLEENNVTKLLDELTRKKCFKKLFENDFYLTPKDSPELIELYENHFLKKIILSDCESKRQNITRTFLLGWSRLFQQMLPNIHNLLRDFEGDDSIKWFRLVSFKHLNPMQQNENLQGLPKKYLHLLETLKVCRMAINIHKTKQEMIIPE